MAATQVVHSWRATVRTAVAVALALASVLPLALSQFHIPLVGAAAIVVAVSGAVTKILANPIVEEFLQHYVPFLSAAPAEAAQIATDVTPAIAPAASVVAASKSITSTPSLSTVVPAVESVTAAAPAVVDAAKAVTADVKADVAQ